MNTSWIVTANAGRARFFSQEAVSSPLEEVKDMLNTQVNLNTSETESDKIGQRAASKSRHSVGAPTQPSGYQPNQLPAEHQTELFARDIANFLLQEYQAGRFQQLTLIASPEFMGVLRKLLDPQLTAIVNLEIVKDYTRLNTQDLRDYIRAQSA